MRYDSMDAAWGLLKKIPERGRLNFLELSCDDGRPREPLHREGISVRGTTPHDPEADSI